VCGFEGQLATPLVYHDPQKELLLTYLPVELNIPKDEQERLIGSLINRAIQNLVPEKRKAYLFQPQAVLTAAGMSERVLQADGITQEQMEAQRARLRLLEELLRQEPDQVAGFVTARDAQFDEPFFQLASLALTSTPEGNARQAGMQRLEEALSHTSVGKNLQAQEAEVRAAVESLRQVQDGLTREGLLRLFRDAPSPERIDALARLTRPALDYAFFQLLSEQGEASQEPEKARLVQLRDRLLDITQRLDRAEQARVAEAAAVLQSLVNAPDLDRALAQALPAVDELFLSLLEANLRAARERKDAALTARLEEIDRRVKNLIAESMPPGLRLAQAVLEAKGEAEAEALLAASPERIDEEFLSALLATAERLQQSDQLAEADRIRDLHRRAVRLSMRRKLTSE
jgi:hypothetical protein